MKLFKDLVIGDEIYKVFTDYRAKEKPYFEKINVTKIELDKDKNLVINSRSGIYGDGFSFKLPIQECAVHMASIGKEGYFTTEKDTVGEVLRFTALNIIKEIENEIASKEKEISRVRKAYWDYLKNDVPTPIELNSNDIE